MHAQRWLLAFLFSAAPLLAQEAEVKDDIPDELRYQTIGIRLYEGEFVVGELLAAVADAVKLDGDVVREKVKWKIDVKGKIGQGKLAVIKTVLGGHVVLEADDDQLLVKIDRLKLRGKEKDLRARLRKFVEKYMPDQAARALSRYGTVVYVSPTESAPLADAEIGRDAVLLVHGLDDAGMLWIDVIPQLIGNKMTPCEFTYPNDQPISDSAKMMAEQLVALEKKGVKTVSIVAHSMGGLMVRDLLTHADYYNGDAAGNDTLPAIDKLIMCGTPNHGSHMARLDVLKEWHEQIIRACSGDGVLFGSIFDGAGEARVDLIPDSEFLIKLNQRPMPKGVAMSIIAGRASPVRAKKIDELTHGMSVKYPKHAEKVEAMGEVLKNMVGGLGDGVVSLKSSQLDGVDDYVEVNANHITMIRRWKDIPYKKGTEIPPGIPIIIDRLRR